MNNDIKKKNIPESLLKKQEKKRKESIDKVQNAIDELRAEGYKITISKLVERTGLARSTLSKPHIDAILKENEVCKYEKFIKSEGKMVLKHDLEKELVEVKAKINKLLLENSELRNKNDSLRLENYELKEKISKVLGELQMLSQKARMHGVRLELIKNIED